MMMTMMMNCSKCSFICVKKKIETRLFMNTKYINKSKASDISANYQTQTQINHNELTPIH